MEQFPVIETRDINKTFPGVKALSGIDFTLLPGEIHCIVGENGAGKSTFIKILSGFLRPESGDIVIGEETFRYLSPHLSQEQGIQVIYQESLLVPQMNVVENIYVGREITGKLGFIDRRKALSETRKVIESLGIALDPQAMVENLEVADRQFVKIIKALAMNPRVLIMDEPTAMFNAQDTGVVLKLVEDISKRGISVIFISHRLEEVARVGDRVTVFKDGRTVASHDNPRRNIDLAMITREMVGRSVDAFYKKVKTHPGETILEVQGLKLDKDSPEVNFTLRRGEILGIAGLVGSGRTEIVEALFGAGKKIQGKIIIRGREVTIDRPSDAIRAGLGFITEERQRTGLALGLSVAKNMTIAGLNKFKRAFITPADEIRSAGRYVDDLAIKTPSLQQEVRFLSGGNQQKVVIARWLFRESEILIFDEPTIGIDVNAKAEIYRLMSKLAANGAAIIMISSEMPELIAMSDRVLVIKHGQITTELVGENITEEKIITYAFGVTDDEQTA